VLFCLLPGTLFIFLLGMHLQSASIRNVWARPARAALVTWLFVLAQWLYIYASPLRNSPSSLETLTGLLIGIPVLAALKGLERQHWDEVLGNVAFPVFLVHFPVLWLLQTSTDVRPTSAPGVALYTLGTLALGTLLWLAVDRPVAAYRRRRRSESLMGGSAASPVEPTAAALGSASARG
jgi:peptidoglycan/LPS O-acetylase OafA/YrhL